MNTPLNARFSFVAGLTLLLGCAGHVAAQGAADKAPPAAGKTAAQVCEAAVTEAIQKSRGQSARQVQFVAPKRALATVPPVEISVHGEGRYMGTGGAMPFTYNCTLDPQTHEATGVIFKDSAEPARAAQKPWQADLTNLSPEACEAAAAASVKEKISRAVNIVLSSKSRQLAPAPAGHTYLHGQGSLERAAGMPPTGFTYRCELDTTSGKLLGVLTELVE